MVSMRRSRVIAGLLVVMFVAFATTALAAGKTVVRYSTWLTHEEEAVEKEIVEAFNKTHPNIEIQLESCAYADYTSKLITQLSAGTAPDVINVSELAEWAAFGVLEDLAPYIAKEPGLLDVFFPKVVDFARYDGTVTGQGPLYGLPMNAGCYILFYNKDMFDRYGIPYPDSTWTFDTLVEVGAKFVEDRDGDGIFDQFGLIIPNVWNDVFVDMIMRGFGGTLWSENRKNCLIGTPAGLDAVQYIADLSNKNHIMPTFAERTATTEQFEMGNLAMVIHHTYANSIFHKRASFNWGIAPLPVGPSGQVGVPVMGHPIAIYANSKVKDAAFEVIKYLISKEVQEKRYRELRTPPSRPDAGDDSVFFQLMSEAISTGYVYTSFPQAQEAWNVIHSYFDRVVLANKPAKEIFTSRVISQIDKALGR